MKNRISKQTERLTLCAVCVALGVVIMTIGALIDVLDLSVAALAGMLSVMVVVEIGGFWPWLVYAATGIIGVLFLPCKLPGAIYLMFCGWYPIIKPRLDRMKCRPVGWLIKLVAANAATTLVVLATKYILALSHEVMELSVVLYAMVNVAFVLYDVALTRLVRVYVLRLRHRLGLDRRNLREK